MLGGLGMFKKIIAGTLITVALTTSSALAYENEIDKTIPENITEHVDQISTDNVDEGIIQQVDQETVDNTKEDQKEIEIISPQINPAGEVLPSKNLLISIKVQTDDAVFLSVYKVTDDNEEVILEPEAVKPGDNLNYYSTQIKDVKPGYYKMKFTKEGQDEPFEVIDFKLLMEIPNLTDNKTTDLMLDQ
jgi:hypothetical protein